MNGRDPQRIAAVRRLARAKEREANARRDWLHKVSKSIVKSYACEQVAQGNAKVSGDRDEAAQLEQILPAQAAMVAELTGSEARLDLAHGKHTTGRNVCADDNIAVQDAGRSHYIVHEQSLLDRPLRAGETVGVLGHHVLEIDSDREKNPMYDVGADLAFDHAKAE